MSEPIFNGIYAIVADRGHGKTLYAIGSDYCTREDDRRLGIPGFINIYLQERKMKVLFIMTFAHPAYAGIPEIPFDVVFTQLHKWKEGVFKIICPLYEVNRLVEYLNEVLWNTAVFMEDTGKILGNVIPMPQKIFIIDSKNKNNDWYGMFHTWMQIPKELYPMIDGFSIGKVSQHPSVRQKEMQDYYPGLLEVWQRVKDHASRFYNETFFTGANG